MNNRVATIQSSAASIDLPVQLPIVVSVSRGLIKSVLAAEAVTYSVLHDFSRTIRNLVHTDQAASHRLSALMQAAPTLNLPFNEDVLRLLQNESERGRRVHCYGDQPQSVLSAQFESLGLFESIVGSTELTPPSPEEKAQRLRHDFPDGYILVSGCARDRPIWTQATAVVLVGNSSQSVQRAHGAGVNILATIPPPNRFAALITSIRLHQASKNALMFIPLFVGFAFTDPAAILRVGIGFIAMTLAASAVYLLNDLSDLQADRRHPTKRKRPLAAGDADLKAAWLALPALAIAALTLAITATAAGAAIILAYMAISTAYSLKLKAVPMLDTVMIGMLFTWRIVAGAVFADVVLSAWLFGFSVFFFYSLALAKRYAEIKRYHEGRTSGVPGRGYVSEDAPIILAFGAAATFSATILLMLYIIFAAYPADGYGAPLFLWGCVASIFLWAARIWLIAGRGQLDDDPIAFALRDRVSWMLGALAALSFAGGVAL